MPFWRRGRAPSRESRGGMLTVIERLFTSNSTSVRLRECGEVGAADNKQDAEPIHRARAFLEDEDREEDAERHAEFVDGRHLRDVGELEGAEDEDPAQAAA